MRNAQHFLNRALFKDGLYEIYRSSETRSIQAFNFIYGGLLGYNFWGYYCASGEAFNQSERENSMIMMGLLGTGMILFNLKVSRTMSRLLIHENGRMSYVEVYRLLGFSRRVVSIENINYKGLNYFLHPSLRIPRINVVESHSGKVQRIFFKEKYCSDTETMKLLMQGNKFFVADPSQHVNISAKARKNFNL